MLKIQAILDEYFDNNAQEFVTEELTLELEHSLVSLSKWESEFKKPFLAKENKTSDEVFGYIRAMLITPDVSSDVINNLSQENLDKIDAYISDKMTATWFNESGPETGQTAVITSELIYYWIVSYQIPWEVENWHLNRLFTLIRVFNSKNTKEKKMTPQQAAMDRQALNEKRRAQYKTTG